MAQIGQGGGSLTVYADLVMLLNGSVDFLLLLGTNRLSGFPTRFSRTLGAATLGAVYSGACLLPEFRFLGNILWRMVSLAGMGILAFGWNRSAIKRSGVFVILSMALGGLALAVGRNDVPALLLAAGGMWMLCAVAFGDGVGSRSYVPVVLGWQGKQVKVLALRDSGNTLRDPITGEQVMVLAADVAAKLTGLTEHQLRNPYETMTSHPIPGLRLIPYRAVGQSGGMLLGLRFSDVQVGTRRGSAIVAFAPEGLGGDMYQALTGGMA